MDRLDALRTFIAVAEQQSFAEAARRLRVSPSAASRAVSELERELGVLLLRRSTRAVALTAEGAVYLQRCRYALMELDDAARDLRGDDAEPQGELIVTAPVVFGRMHVLPVALELMRHHPKLTIRLTLLDRLVRLVEEGVDAALRIAELPDSALHAVRVTEVRRVLVASPGYLAAHGTPTEPAALRSHALLVFDNFAIHGEWRFGPEGQPAVRLAPRLVTNDVEAAIAAALDGMGIARALSYQVAAHVAAGRLAYVLPQFDPPPVPVQLVFQAGRARAPKLRTFVAALRAHIQAASIE